MSKLLFNEGFFSRLLKLKEVNGDLKLILLIRPLATDWMLYLNKERNIITNGVKWLNESGFDGLAFPLYIKPSHRDKLADFLCEMKSEFDKYGYMLTSLIIDHSFPEPAPGKESTISKLARKMRDSSLGWTVRRDNATQEPYAFSTTGLWSSYEDTTSMAFKARYVLEKDLHGLDIVVIDVDDDEGVGGEGRFPLTRAVYNTCCDHVSLITEERGRYSETYRLAPLSFIKSNVDWFIERELPAEKITFTVPAFGVYVTLENHNETELGAKYSGPGLEYKEFSGWNTIRYKELLRTLNDSSLGWTFRRDKETKEPYAFSTTGLWTSYEDATSISFKARYVMEKGLHGMDIVAVDVDDDEGVEGEGRFPLTRAIYNTFNRGNQSLDAKP
ncbi:hypothetical protein J437_LFUL012097 [Ladona fulva]|uniref:GH18 domain-containing protein n=1 Tax=Ladona fulva TaxID=123851 RepID=A0A8K0JXL1_LADFU|nr:hypothetical protein J437_LFUL012097 [Ladona fulva]